MKSKKSFKILYEKRSWLLVFCVIFTITIIGTQFYIWKKNENNMDRIMDSIYVYLNPGKVSSDLKMDLIISIDSSIIFDSSHVEIIHAHNAVLISYLKMQAEISSNSDLNYKENQRQTQNIYFGILAILLALISSNGITNKAAILKIVLFLILIMFFLELDYQFQEYKFGISTSKITNSIVKLTNLNPSDKNWYIYDDPLQKSIVQENEHSNLKICKEDKSASKRFCKRNWIRLRLFLTLRWDWFFYYEVPFFIILVLLFIKKRKK